MHSWGTSSHTRVHSVLQLQPQILLAHVTCAYTHPHIHAHAGQAYTCTVLAKHTYVHVHRHIHMIKCSHTFQRRADGLLLYYWTPVTSVGKGRHVPRHTTSCHLYYHLLHQCILCPQLLAWEQSNVATVTDTCMIIGMGSPLILHNYRMTGMFCLCIMVYTYTRKEVVYTCLSTQLKIDSTCVL